MNGGAPLKGETKFFFQEKTIDMLLSMIMALGSEISALSEKLDTVIDILADRDIADVAYIETFEPGPEQQARRDAARKRLVATLLAAYQDEADTLASPESSQPADDSTSSLRQSAYRSEARSCRLIVAPE